MAALCYAGYVYEHCVPSIDTVYPVQLKVMQAVFNCKHLRHDDLSRSKCVGCLLENTGNW